MTIAKDCCFRAFIACALLVAGVVAAPAFAQSGLPKAIKFLSIQDLSGLAGKPGADTRLGMDLAVEEINRGNLLGGGKIEISYRDSATNPAQGANLMSAAIGQQYAIVFGSVASGVAIAEAPIAQRGRQPLIFTQAGSKGILEAGNYIYRATPLQTDFFHIAVEHMQKIGIRRLGILTDINTPTVVDLRTVTKQAAPKYKIEVVADEEITTSAADISTQITKMIAAKPDAALILMLAGRSVSAVSQLRQNGFKGRIVGNQAMGGRVLAPLGEVADGVIWATDFNPAQKNPGAVKFVAAYKAKYAGQTPSNFAAEGYDAVYFAAQGLKKANSAEPDAVIKGLEAAGKEGFEGALGQVKFSGRQELGSGVMVEWRKGEELPVQ